MAGKSYRCLRCGACCVGDGSAFLYPDDLRSLAGHLGLSLQATIDRHTDYLILEIPDGAHGWLYLPYLILKKDAKERCVFLKEALCSVHAAKPAQCRETPFVEEFFSDDEYERCWLDDDRGSSFYDSEETAVHDIHGAFPWTRDVQP